MCKVAKNTIVLLTVVITRDTVWYDGKRKKGAEIIRAYWKEYIEKHVMYQALALLLCCMIFARYSLMNKIFFCYASTVKKLFLLSIKVYQTKYTWKAQ